MTNIATDLRERIDFAMFWFLEQYEVLPDGQTITDLSEDDAKAVDILEMLGDTKKQKRYWKLSQIYSKRR
jgi:xylose isomerase